MEVMGGDGEPVVFSRWIGCIYYLSKNWQPQFGGQFVDIQSQRWPVAPCITPAFNSLVAFSIPRKYLLSAVRGVHTAPLYAMHGWWLQEGELYSVDEEEAGQEDEAAAGAAASGDLDAEDGPARCTRAQQAAKIARIAASGAGELSGAMQPPNTVPEPVLRACERSGGGTTSGVVGLTAAQCRRFDREGLVVVDGVLPLSWATSVQMEVEALEISGRMAATQQERYGVRQDKVCWLTSNSAPPNCGLALAYLGTVASALNKQLGLSLLAPEAAMATCYDGEGSHFIVHRDNTCDAAAAASWAGAVEEGCINAREATAILYANCDWKPEHGGELRCHIGADSDDATGETARSQRDVAPIACRLVVFKSRELLHEVLPSYKRRVAISLWLLDGALPLRTDAT